MVSTHIARITSNELLIDVSDITENDETTIGPHHPI